MTEKTVSVRLLSLAECEKIPLSYGEERFPRRMEKLSRCSRREDRLRSFGAGVLLTAFAGIREDDVLSGEYGKPYLAGAVTQFSLSHGGDYAAIALFDGAVGVDIEPVTSRHLSLAARVLTAEERAWVGAGEDACERFLTLWTRKESAAKCLGLGLNLPFGSFDTLPLGEKQPIFVNGQALSGESVVFAGHCLSVVTDAPARLDFRILTAEELF